MLNSLRAQHIELKTEGTTFHIGEAVKGYFILTAHKSFKINDASVSMYGKEKTNIVGWTAGPVPAEHNRWKASNTFATWEVPPSDLFSSIGAKQIDLYTLEVPAGIKQVPFEFILPEDMLESYKGKYVSITYTIEAKVDVPRSLGLRKRQEIVITSANKDNNNDGDNNGTDDWHKGDNREGPSSIEIPIDSSSNNSILVGNPATKNSVSSLAYQVRMGNQYRGFPKLARNLRFHKKTNTIRLELDKTIFSRGEKIYGRLVLMNITQPDKIRKIEITLSGIEFATINTEDPINQAVGLMEGLQPVDLCSQHKAEEYTKEIEIPKKERDSSIIIPFEFQIPKQLKRSYTGKYSKFYWLVDARIDMKGMVDSHTEEEITII